MDLKPSKISNRILAGFFDFLILFALCLVVLIPSIVSLINLIVNNTALNSAAMYVSSFFSGALYVVLLVFYLVVLPVIWKGQTLGKKFFRIATIKANGKEIDYRTMVVREVAFIFFLFISLGLSLLIDIITIACSKKHNSYFDIIATTNVVDVTD